MPGLDLVVLVDEVQQVQLLALVLMQTLGLDIEHGIGVHRYLLGVQQPLGQRRLVGLFHGGQFVQHGLVVCKGQQLFQLGGVLAETGADVLFQLAVRRGRTPAASGGR